MAAVCRSIRVLYHFQPPTTPEEIRAAALQYVRKVSGVNRPAEADAVAFDGQTGREGSGSGHDIVARGQKRCALIVPEPLSCSNGVVS